MLLGPTSLALAACLALAAPVAMASPDTTPIATERVAATPSAPAQSAQDSSRYAEREHHDTKVANYTGGSIVVIGVSTGTVILVLILILLLA